jgi:hypothetical protein
MNIILRKSFCKLLEKRGFFTFPKLKSKVRIKYNPEPGK